MCSLNLHCQLDCICRRVTGQPLQNSPRLGEVPGTAGISVQTNVTSRTGPDPTLRVLLPDIPVQSPPLPVYRDQDGVLGELSLAPPTTP